MPDDHSFDIQQAQNKCLAIRVYIPRDNKFNAL